VSQNSHYRNAAASGLGLIFGTETSDNPTLRRFGTDCFARGDRLKQMATILIAEDYDDNRELLRLVLSAAGYDVREARNGHECVRVARESPPDLVMVDLSMPELDGWGAFQALKSDPLTAAIPCVAVTAQADTARQRVLQLGFDGFVGKPFKTDDLLSTVAKLIAKQIP
jgi:two-component system cell cycle response regulator DivK